MDLRQYILTVTAAALVCAIAVRLIPQSGTIGALSRLIMGLFVAVSVVSPVISFRLQELTDLTDRFRLEAQQAVQQGVGQGDDLLRQSIKEQVSAYILSKAQDLGLQVSVEVTLSEDAVPVPERITISGDAGAYAKSRLQDVIASDIGIPKEDQLWT